MTYLALVLLLASSWSGKVNLDYTRALDDAAALGLVRWVEGGVSYHNMREDWVGEGGGWVGGDTVEEYHAAAHGVSGRDHVLDARNLSCFRTWWSEGWALM